MASIPEIFSTMAYGPAPEAAAPAQAWLEAHGRRFGLFIGGAWTDGKGESFETLNPATAKPLARLAQASAADVDARCARPARRSRPGGRSAATAVPAICTPSPGRSRSRAASSPSSNRSTTASRSASPATSTFRSWRATSITTPAGRSSWSRSCPDRVPVGVVGQIIPWNFPLLMLAWKIAPALAMGNTVVLKPAEFTSLTALRFAEMCEEIGLPAGVVNIITGDGRTGEALVAHPDVDKIAFTGSTEVGRIIRAATAGSGKKLSLELGGKSPFIVFEDADLDSVVEGVVDAIWFNQGQVCCAGSRILAQEGVAERLVAKLRARMETLRVGDPLDKAVDIGAIVAPVQLEKIQELVRQGEEEGARLWQPSWSCPREGWFYPPTLFTDVSPAATIAQVEIFGPVVVADDLPHAVRGGRAGQQHPLRAGGERLDREHQPRAGHRTAAQGGHGLDQLHQRVRRGERVRRLSRERIRARGRPRGAARIREMGGGAGGKARGRQGGKSGTRMPAAIDAALPPARLDRPARPSTARRSSTSAASRPGPTPATASRYWARRAPGWARWGTATARTSATRSKRRTRRRDGREATAHNRAQVLYYIAENLAARADEFAPLAVG